MCGDAALTATDPWPNVLIEKLLECRLQMYDERF